MLFSMTGYGKAQVKLPFAVVNIEVKTLNSKQLDLNCKIPYELRDKEILLRNIMSAELKRGKAELLMYMEKDTESDSIDLNESLFQKYYQRFNDLAKTYDLPESDRIMLSVLKMPDVLTPEKPQIEDNEWDIIQKGVTEAIAACTAFRKQEGAATEKDMVARVNRILELRKKIEPFEGQRIEVVRDRIKDHLQNSDVSTIDENRFEQELIFYLEKMDVTEEKVRLDNHCAYFLETAEANDGAIGKKLNFILQEMGREINTLGSKANHAEIQKIVVEMKDELEKLKEQSLNIL